MAQPKKLSPKEKQAKKENKQMDEIAQNLQRVRQALHTKTQQSSQLETWRWAALNIFNQLSNLDIRHETHRMAALKSHALDTAREAQFALNFR